MKNKNKLPFTWAEPGFELFLRSRVLPINGGKVKMVTNFNQSFNNVITSDLAEVTLTEAISIDLSNIAKKPDLLETAATLQAFQTYRLSLYDLLADNHIERFGKPTVLGKYGQKAIKETINLYGLWVLSLSKELEKKGIPKARRFAEKQYKDTLKADQFRNSFRSQMPSPKQAMKMQRELAGKDGQIMAYLTGANKIIGEATACLIDALTTLEDLMGVIDLEDFDKPKATIPLAFFYQEKSHLIKPTNSRKIIDQTRVVTRTRSYINGMLQKAEGPILDYQIEGPVLARIFQQVSKFNEVFPENYI